jgi:hypothetical protein
MCHALPKLSALFLLVATAFFGAACGGGKDRASPPPTEPGASTLAGRAPKLWVDCNDCGNGWYCDAEGNVVYEVSDGHGNCNPGSTIICANGCNRYGCDRPDTCF